MDDDWLAERFERSRTHLRAVAYRMLGSISEADDAVQESWLRLSRSDISDVQNLDGWLTTVVSRVCLDMLRARRSRREEPLVFGGSEPTPVDAGRVDPEQEVELADSVGAALLVVLQTLAPAERLAFVLHDLFAVPFEEIAVIVGRSPTATRQLASRARRRVQASANTASTDRARHREVVAAFLAASRSGNFDALLELLDPAAVLRADAVAVRSGASDGVQGADAVAQTFSGRAKAARLALVDGAVGAVWMAGGQARVVFAFTVQDAKVTAIELIADPDRIEELELVMLTD